MRLSAPEERYSVVTIFNKPALFTSLRIKRDTVPGNLYCYDIRDADDGSWAAEVKGHVFVNHMGTIITKEPIKPRIFEGVQYSVEEGIPLEEYDFSFLPDSDINLSDFIKTSDAVILKQGFSDVGEPEMNL